MTLTKKIAFYSVLTLLSLPCVMIFNDSEDAWYLNFIGVAYAFAMYKIAPRFLPKWFMECVRDTTKWAG